eukprot:5028258-Amphidinium_carterae.1
MQKRQQAKVRVDTALERGGPWLLCELADLSRNCSPKAKCKTGAVEAATGGQKKDRPRRRAHRVHGTRRRSSSRGGGNSGRKG